MGQVKFAGWHIDGFGLFNNYEVKNLSAQVTIFLGPNEAGKSTLLGFLRYMMFGFQPYNKTENRYPPLNGGRHGGRLILSGDNGDYMIERYNTPKDSCTLWKPDGSAGSPQELVQLLGHADQQLYKSIFAFSLTELEDPKFKDSEQIRDRLAAGSLQGSKTSARDALKRLSEANALIHKPHGQKTRLQKLKGELNDCTRALNEAQKSIAEYSALCREETEVDTRLKDLSQSLGLEQVKNQRYRTLQDLWPQWCTRNQYQQDLQRLAQIDTFPLNAKEHHTALCTSLESLDDQALALRIKEEQLHQLKDENRPNPVLLELHPQILGLYQRKALYLSWSDNLQKSEYQASQAKQELESGLNLLGEGWNRERLSGFSVDLPQIEEIRTWGDRLNQAHETRKLNEQRLLAVQTRCDESQRQAKITEERLNEAGTDLLPDELDRQEESLTQLRIHLAEQKEKSAQLGTLEERIRTAQAMPTGQNGSYSSKIRLGLWILTALLLGAGAMAIVSGGVVWGSLMAIAGVVTLALSLMTPKGVTQESSGPERLKTELTALKKELQTLESCIRTEAAPFGPGDRPSLIETDNWVQRLARQREDAKTRKGLVQEHKQALETFKECQQTLTETEEELAAAKTQQEELLTQWNQWLEDHHIKSHSPQGAIDFLQSVKEAQKSLAVLEQAEKTSGEMRQELEDFCLELAQLCQRADIPIQEDDALVTLESLWLKDNTNEELRQRLAEVEKSHQDITQQLEALSLKQKDTQNRLASLYAETGATTEEEFNHRLSIFEKRQLLKQSLRQAEMDLEQRMGHGANEEELSQMLAEGNIEGWEQAIAQSEQARAELADAKDKANRRLGELAVERKKREEACDINTLENQIQSLQETFVRLSREWTVRALAEGMIKETFQVLEQTRQPAVLAQASDLFRRVSAGEYESVRQVEDAGIQVISREQKRIDPKVLSRGTAEQLYLCLRLGLIREFSQQSGGLPLVMDDVLVNFDPERTRNMVKALCHFAEESQLLLFTCHPQTAELFASLHNARIIELPKAGVLVT